MLLRHVLIIPIKHSVLFHQLCKSLFVLKIYLVYNYYAFFDLLLDPNHFITAELLEDQLDQSYVGLVFVFHFVTQFWEHLGKSDADGNCFIGVEF